MIYLDNNATTRPFDHVVEAMRPFLSDNFANPASAIGHFTGLDRAIAVKKTAIARCLGATDGKNLIITSGATESNNLAFLGAARANPSRKHIMVLAVEHPSVLETAEFLKSTGLGVTVLPVSPSGLVDPAQLLRAISSDTLLVSVMLANNESGVLQPVHALAAAVKAYDPEILFHTDATQAAGRISINLESDLAAVDLLSLSAHKFHGPKGVGALFIRDLERIAPIQFGGGQQAGLRSGTENAAAVAGMAAALTSLQPGGPRTKEMARTRDWMEEQLLAHFPAAFVVGATSPRIPNTSFICLPGIDGGELVDALAAQGIAVSTGSACSHGAQSPSYVALAMGLDHAQAKCCIRISLSLESTRVEVETLVAAVMTFRSTLLSATNPR